MTNLIRQELISNTHKILSKPYAKLLAYIQMHNLKKYLLYK